MTEKEYSKEKGSIDDQLFRLSIEDLATYEAMFRIAEIILEYTTRDEHDNSRPFMIDLRSNEIEPDCCPEYTGLQLVCVDDEPLQFDTPWGGWQCFGSTERDEDRELWREIIAKLKSRFDMRVIFADPEEGVIVYHINEVDGVLLPAFRDIPRVGDDYVARESRSAIKELEMLRQK